MPYSPLLRRHTAGFDYEAIGRCLREDARQAALGFIEVLERTYVHIDVWRVLHGQHDIPAWLLGDMHAGTSSDSR